MSEIDYKTAYETTNEIVNLYYARIKRNEDEIERLHSIIKEVREYITKQVHRNQQFYEMDIENILEILDKEKNNV